MMDRGRDAADIFTASVGGGVGAKARIGPIQTGLLADIPIYGLRGGEIASQTGWPYSLDFQWVIGGVEAYVGGQRRKKGFCIASTRLPLMPDIKAPFTPFVHGIPANTDYSPSYYTQIEAVVGLIPSLRLGFNPGELLDFILGWGNIDIYKDDIEMKKTESNHGLESTSAPPAAGTLETHP